MGVIFRFRVMQFIGKNKKFVIEIVGLIFPVKILIGTSFYEVVEHTKG